MRSRAAMFAGGALVGLVAGWLLAQYRFVRRREDLFSNQPLRRLGALGFLAGQQGVETVRLLQDYLTWETQPVLRRRAETLVRRMEAALG
jgi:hypothetical protein